MPVYRGVIRGNVVMLPDGVEFADGAAVEVRVIANAAPVWDTETEWLFKQRLLESGFI